MKKASFIIIGLFAAIGLISMSPFFNSKIGLQISCNSEHKGVAFCTFTNPGKIPAIAQGKIELICGEKTHSAQISSPIVRAETFETLRVTNFTPEFGLFESCDKIEIQGLKASLVPLIIPVNE